MAVLLRAVGVRRDDVVADWSYPPRASSVGPSIPDYLRTEANLPRLWAALHGAGIRPPRNRTLMGVQLGAMESVLDELDAAPDGAAGWLAAHGVDAGTLARLTDRMLSPGARTRGVTASTG